MWPAKGRAGTCGSWGWKILGRADRLNPDNSSQWSDQMMVPSVGKNLSSSRCRKWDRTIEMELLLKLMRSKVKSEKAESGNENYLELTLTGHPRFNSPSISNREKITTPYTRLILSAADTFYSHLSSTNSLRVPLPSLRISRSPL